MKGKMELCLVLLYAGLQIRIRKLIIKIVIKPPDKHRNKNLQAVPPLLELD